MDRHYLSATSGFGLNLLLGIYYGFDEDDDLLLGDPLSAHCHRYNVAYGVPSYIQKEKAGG